MTLRALERGSIRMFLEANAWRLTGRVLDYGAGQQPYRDVVEAVGGSYRPFDRKSFPGSVSDVTTASPRGVFDAVICTQVIQFAPDTQLFLREIRDRLKPGGCLLITGPTNWVEVEDTDLRRFTQVGIRFELKTAGFEVESVIPRAFHLSEPSLSLGWGAVALA